MTDLCCEYLYVWYIWLHFIIMSRLHFKVNLHCTVAWVFFYELIDCGLNFRYRSCLSKEFLDILSWICFSERTSMIFFISAQYLWLHLFQSKYFFKKSTVKKELLLQFDTLSSDKPMTAFSSSSNFLSIYFVKPLIASNSFMKMFLEEVKSCLVYFSVGWWGSFRSMWYFQWSSGSFESLKNQQMKVLVIFAFPGW